VSVPLTPAELRRYLPWLVAVALFMENLDSTIVNTAAPRMAEGFGVEPLSIKGVLTSYTLALAVCIPISGWVADRFGARRVFEVAILIFTAGSLLCGIAMNVPMLVVSRLLQGMGGAMMSPVGRLALVRTFPRSEMIRAMNYVIIPALIGPLVGPFLGGAITHWLHWRVIFFINLPLGILGIWLARRWMPDYRSDQPTPIDLPGMVLFSTGILLLSYALEVLGEHRLPVSTVLQLGGAGVVLLGAYVWHARRVPHPLLSLGLFRVRTFRISVVGGFVTRLGSGGMPFLLPLLYQVGLGYLPWQAGLLMMPQVIGSMAMKLVNRQLLARFGHRNVLRWNTGLMGLLLASYSFIGPGTPVPAIVMLSFFQGFVSSIQFTSMNSLVYADVSDNEASRASSIAITGQHLSVSFGIALGSVTASLFLSSVPAGNIPAFITAIHYAFILLGVTTAVSGLVFAGLRPDDGANVSRHRTVEEVEGDARQPAS
jgi:EmrB/QacA subfamily drug resistance transporter